MSNNKFDKVDNQVDFISLEHEMLKKWDEENTFERLRFKTKVMKLGPLWMVLLRQTILWGSSCMGQNIEGCLPKISCNERL